MDSVQQLTVQLWLVFRTTSGLANLVHFKSTVVVTYTCNPPWETEAGGSEAQDQPWLPKTLSAKINKQELINYAGRCRCTLLIPASGRQQQADLCEFATSLVYKS